MASFTTKSAVCGTPIAHKAPLKPVLSRACVAVRASGDDQSRRGFLGLVAGAAFVATRVEAIEITDDRKVRATGYDIIDQARDLDLPQSTRDGIDQFRGNLASTKARLAESVARLKKDVPPNIEKQYWVQAREELRRQLGTMRFDLDTIARSLGDKQSRKSAQKASDDFFILVEVLDDALRLKNQEAATKAFEKTIAAVGTLNLG